MREGPVPTLLRFHARITGTMLSSLWQDQEDFWATEGTETTEKHQESRRAVQEHNETAGPEIRAGTKNVYRFAGCRRREEPIPASLRCLRWYPIMRQTHSSRTAFLSGPIVHPTRRLRRFTRHEPRFTLFPLPASPSPAIIPFGTTPLMKM